MQGSNLSVIPLNPGVNEFQESLRLLKKYQCFPMLMIALENCIEIKSDMKTISSCLNEIFLCSND